MTVWFQHVPLRAQLHEPSGDSGPDNNAASNCWPACGGSALTYYTGRPYYGDALKDAVLGETYTGATDPEQFIPYITSQGVHMYKVVCSGTAATDRIIAEVKAGAVVTGAIPSQWGNTTAADVADHGGPTHEVLWCGYDDQAGTLTAMNPEMAGQADWHTMPVAWWASRIVYGRIFPMEGKTVAQVTPTYNPQASTLAFPAHDGIPAITLTHNQAYFGSTQRQGVYPIHGEGYEGDDSVVIWSDGQKSKAVKAQGWAVHLEDAGPTLAGIYAAADQVTPLSQQVASLKAQVSALAAELAKAEAAGSISAADAAVLAAARAWVASESQLAATVAAAK